MADPATAMVIAGLVLAAIPILISAIEHRDTGSLVMNGLFFKTGEIKILKGKLRDQYNIYRQCCITIFNIAEVEYMSDLLEDGLSDEWASPDIVRALKSRLLDFDSFERHVKTIHSTVEALQRQVASNRLKLALKGRSRKIHIRILEEEVSMLSKLVDGHHRNRDILSVNHPDIKAVKIARSRRYSLYRGLETSWGCVCKTSHIAKLRLHSKACKDDLSLLFEFDVNSKIETSRASTGWLLQPMGVRSWEKTDTNFSSAPTCQNLCDTFRGVVRTHADDETTAGSLKDSEFRHELSLRSKLPDKNFVRLRDVLGNARGQGELPLRERINLGSLLLNAVLQHHGLPWLPEAWGSADIFLQPCSKDGKPQYKPFFKAQFTEPSPRANRSPFILNNFLFNLAIVLIELGYDKPLDDLMSKEELAGIAAPVGAEWARAGAVYRLANELYDQVAHKEFYEAAWRCCKGNFGKIPPSARDLDDEQLFAGVYWTAAKPLMDVLHGYAPNQILI